MTNTINIASLFFVIIASFWSHPVFSHNIPNSPNLINQACEATKHADLCKNTLTSFPNNDTTDLHALATRALEYATLNATKVEEQITQLLRESREDEFAEQCFHDCSQTYYDSVQQLENSMVALDDKRYDEVREWVMAAMSDVETCGEECESPSPLASINDRFNQLCSNVLSLVNLLAA